MMSVLDDLKMLGGCNGGVAIYTHAKTAALVANVARERRKLWSTTVAVMQAYFPKLHLGKVEFCINSTLPANWFKSADNVDGMTFGYTIFFKGSNIQKTQDGLALLMHELVHVDQVRRRGDSELKFACDYGDGYLQAGSYEANPLEKEAYDFVTANRSSLPNGVKKATGGGTGRASGTPATRTNIR
jgi:hypothetical protein